MGSTPSKYKGDNLPVESVSWNDCIIFISKLNSLTGKIFRLPTEAEWEFAARGGKNTRYTQFSGSNNQRLVAWYDADSSGNGPHPVAKKHANELGIFDMSGNVWEWCNDWYGKYISDAQTNPQGPKKDSGRVLRGGSWFSRARHCRVSYRHYKIPMNHFNLVGIRLVMCP
jgi:formylglycine-generating enzyme required for sulfatase activity